MCKNQSNMPYPIEIKKTYLCNEETNDQVPLDHRLLKKGMNQVLTK